MTRALVLLLLVSSALAASRSAAAQSYRHPSDCGDGCMTVSAYYDHGGGTDWACGGHTYGGHHGTDFATYGGWAAVDEGRAVVAAAPGTVVEANDGEFDRCSTGDCSGGGGFGNYVAIQHADGRITYYGHMRNGSIAVGVGAVVGCGQFIGFVASSGWSTGPHVHFEPRVGGSGIDPFGGGCSGGSSWVDQGPYLGLPSMACEAVCTPHCEGSVIVDSGCGSGDCAAYGSGCVDDGLGARCVFFACPAVGEADVCIDDAHITHCRNGLPDPAGDCGAYAARCSTAGAPGARCVSIFCTSSAAEIPTEHPTCLPNGQLLNCHADASADVVDCPAGESCVADGSGAHCAGPAPAPDDAGTVTPEPVDAGAHGEVTPDASTHGEVPRDASLPASDAGGPIKHVVHGGCSTTHATGSSAALAPLLALLAVALRGRRRGASAGSRS